MRMSDVYRVSLARPDGHIPAALRDLTSEVYEDNDEGVIYFVLRDALNAYKVAAALGGTVHHVCLESEAVGAPLEHPTFSPNAVKTARHAA